LKKHPRGEDDLHRKGPGMRKQEKSWKERDSSPDLGLKPKRRELSGLGKKNEWKRLKTSRWGTQRGEWRRFVETSEKIKKFKILHGGKGR